MSLETTYLGLPKTIETTFDNFLIAKRQLNGPVIL